MEWSEDDGEDFDRANLLLAKSYADKVSNVVMTMSSLHRYLSSLSLYRDLMLAFAVC